MTPDHAAPQRARGDILFIASAHPEYVRVALRGLREAYPRASFDAIARQEALAATTAVDGCNVIYVTGTAQGRVELVRRLRNARYPTVAFIEAGSGGHVALQMLPLVLGIRNIILLDEDGVAISIRPGKAALIARHAKLRLSKHIRVRLQYIILFIRSIFHTSTLWLRNNTNFLPRKATFDTRSAGKELSVVKFFSSRRDYALVYPEKQGDPNHSLYPWQREVLIRWNFNKHHSIINGHCSICISNVIFIVDLQFGGKYTSQNLPIPNWRERVICKICGLNQRFRSSILMVKKIAPTRTSRIWIAEQVTPLYQQLKYLYPELIGSEYCPPDNNKFVRHQTKIRHEDITNTMFNDNQFDLVCSFDVMEHVANYHSAIIEAFRILVSGGHFLWSAPMDIESDITIIRASVLADLTIVHHLLPEYHGDPLGSGGSLCFQYFGWDILDVLRSVGFIDCSVVSITSVSECISPQYFILARRP